jgi:transposase
VGSLNYKYRLYPTEAQAHALSGSMRLIRWGWNLAVRRERWARKMIRLGRAANLHKFLAEQASSAQLRGRRAANLARLVEEEGISKDEAKSRLNAVAVQNAWRWRRSGLSVNYAIAAAIAAKRSMVHGRLGKAWAKLFAEKGKFPVGWKACWNGLRNPPRKNKDRLGGWLAVQMQNQNPTVWEKATEHGDNWVDLGLLMPTLSGAETNVRFRQHRVLPDGSRIVEMKIVRRRERWWLVFSVDADVPKQYPTTGKACGISYGESTPATAAGEEMEAGSDGLSLGPQRPLTKALKKVARLERKLERQRRANNPHCYDAHGAWVRGARLSHFTKGMRETEDRISREHARCANIRKDAWNKAGEEVYTRFDTVYISDWNDGTPERKAGSRSKRKSEPPPKRQAAQQSDRERLKQRNALGLFRRILEEKASRSEGKKSLVVVAEQKTIAACCRCGELEGASGQRELNKRSWTCPKCGYQQDRDRAAAWNILQAGVRQAGGQPVKEGRVVPRVAGSTRAVRGSAVGIERTSESSQAGAVPSNALTSALLGVTDRDSRTVKIRGPARERAGPQPLTEGTVNSSQ